MRKKKKIGVLYIIIGAIVLVVLIHVISCSTLDKMIEYKEETFSSEQWPPVMDGYKIAFITDTHAMTVQDYEDVMQELNQWKPDLLLLGGDFPSSSGSLLESSMEILSQVMTTDGIYGVEGNHDHYATLFAAMQRHSIQPLSNSGTYIREHFYLAGTEDLWNRHPDIAVATKEAQPEDFVLLVSHNPDTTMQQDTTSVDLILSGHTHGGHVTLFGVFAPELALRKSITDYGQRFMSGWATSRDGVPVYVSRGTGYYTRTPRIFARPQVILITLFAG